ncbi:DUF3999 family protein [Bacillus sp. FJAT-42376]|uniref:DUF3999 family protein n=1 Tax=Bacillus sp. FJAT-42376 TaxID=2014076 RepID=UPI000F4E659F|nr:DUF3999 family protein [Bacillus sp. FJAT-42376]AZB41031.1 DUF3999 family protein [Bacillus sp. FJAT-42376]
MFQLNKKSILLAAAFLLGSSPPSALAEKDTWKFAKNIEIQNEGKYQSLFLDEEVYSGAREDLGDVRIVNEKGQTVPYYMKNGYGNVSEQETVYSSEPLPGREENGNTLYDFKMIQDEKNTDIVGETLKADLPDQPFLKKTQVLGSYDGLKWEPVTEDTLYNTGEVKKDTIDLGMAMKYTYYRVKILDNAEKINLPGLSLIHSETRESFKEFSKQKTPEFTAAEKGKQTVITIENKQRLKIAKVSVNAAGNFRRTVEIEEGSGLPVSLSGEAELYRADFKDTRILNTDLTFQSPSSAGKITITISNEDNAPLDLQGITITYLVDELVFEKKSAGPYQLLYGSKNAQIPQYDIEEFRSFIEKESVSEATLGSSIKRPQKAAPKEEKQVQWFQTEWVFNTIIALISVLLIVFILQKMTKVKK